MKCKKCGEELSRLYNDWVCKNVKCVCYGFALDKNGRAK